MKIAKKEHLQLNCRKTMKPTRFTSYSCLVVLLFIARKDLYNECWLKCVEHNKGLG